VGGLSLDWLGAVTDARKRGSFEDAMRILTSELAKRPSDGSIYYQIAWTHDALGREADAAPAYERAIALGLSDADLEGAYLGLGSTYRCIGDYDKSLATFKRAVELFPTNNAFRVFSSLTLFNLGQAEQSIRILLKQLVATTTDENIKKYGQALLFYSDKLSEKFE
jgi:tetratricopeptide (TPR) repeat protein